MGNGRVLGLAMALFLAGIGPSLAQTNSSEAADAVSATLERLGMKLSPERALMDPIRRPLLELTREKCDQRAIANLGKALNDTGYRREAAEAHLRFSDTCNGHARSVQAAANILLELSDYPAAAAAASKLIELEPHGDNGYFLRAVASDRSNLPAKAIEDYATATELYGDKSNISSVSYFAISRNYEKLGKFCDAMTPIETWVSINPGRYDTSQTRALIASYSAKGQCDKRTSGVEDVFPITRANNVIMIAATINGVRGNFVLDTGATWVCLKSSFAQKAKINIDQGSVVKLMTANGLTEGRSGRATSVRLRTLEAKDVVVVVQDDTKRLYGDGIDGLLGMSFLSRFQVSIDGKQARIRNRSASNK
jgi:clan AA aspartic protease (TIGR02281 family)